MDLVRLLEVNAYHMYLLTLCAGNATRKEQTYARMTDPLVGDVVVEISTIWDERRNGTRLGELRAILRVPTMTAEEWSNDLEPIPEKTVYDIKLPNGTEVRWDDAQFIRAFKTMRELP